MHEIVRPEGRLRNEHHKAHHFLAPHLVWYPDGCDLGDFGAPHQDTIDLKRRDIDASADDDVLLATREMQETVGVKVADIAGANAADTAYLHRPIIGETAIGVVVPGT